MSNELKESKAMYEKAKKDAERYARRAERTEQQLIDMKKFADEQTIKLNGEKEHTDKIQNNLQHLKTTVKEKDHELHKLYCFFYFVFLF